MISDLLLLFVCLFRGLTEEDFEQVAEFFDRAVHIALDVKAQTGTKIKDFRHALEHGAASNPELLKLHHEVTAFARKFPTVGF